MRTTKSLIAAGIFAAAVSTSGAQASDITSASCGENWGPKASVAPTYPRRAQERGVEGYIVMTYSVAEDGSVVDVSVSEAKPLRAFVRSATKGSPALAFPSARGRRISDELNCLVFTISFKNTISRLRIGKSAS